MSPKPPPTKRKREVNRKTLYALYYYMYTHTAKTNSVFMQSVEEFFCAMTSKKKKKKGEIWK